MRRPTIIRINGRDVRLRMKSKVVVEGDECNGAFYPPKNLIEMETKQGPLQERDTYLHEVIHAVLNYSGVEVCAAEEKYVRATASGLLGVFLDNPEFAQWLLNITPQPK